MKVTFLSPLVLEKLDGENWKVTSDFDVEIEDDERYLITWRVPAGYVTDLASVPRWPLTYLLAGGRAPKSAVLHDWLYAYKADRDWADKVFLAGMEAEGINAGIRNLMYWGVRIGGESRYNDKERL